jgi:hypothetical protein
MWRYYIEPAGWLLVCLLFLVRLGYLIAPFGVVSRQPARQNAVDMNLTKPSGP